MDKYLKGNELYFTAKCSARCSLPDASNLLPATRCPSCLRAAEPSACLPPRLRAAGLADREMVGFDQEPSAPPFRPQPAALRAFTVCL